MTDLRCDAVYCTFNCADRCCRSDIHVGGEDALDSHETTCQSFRYTPGGTANLAEYGSTHSAVPISCEAENCLYNRGGHCDAHSIRVGGHAAQQNAQTRCETFVHKQKEIPYPAH